MWRINDHMILRESPSPSLRYEWSCLACGARDSASSEVVRDSDAHWHGEHCDSIKAREAEHVVEYLTGELRDMARNYESMGQVCAPGESTARLLRVILDRAESGTFDEDD